MNYAITVTLDLFVIDVTRGMWRLTA